MEITATLRLIDKTSNSTDLEVETVTLSELPISENRIVIDKKHFFIGHTLFYEYGLHSPYKFEQLLFHVNSDSIPNPVYLLQGQLSKEPEEVNQFYQIALTTIDDRQLEVQAPFRHFRVKSDYICIERSLYQFFELVYKEGKIFLEDPKTITPLQDFRSNRGLHH